jgi:hypothetical protein
VTIAGTATIITVEGEAIRVTSKLIDGTFPEYNRLMQAPGAFRICVPSKALDAAIGRLLVLPRKDGKGKAETSRPIRMTPVDGGLKLEIKGNDADAEDLVDCEVEGAGEPIVVNYRLRPRRAGRRRRSKVTFAPIEGNAGRRAPAARQRPFFFSPHADAFLGDFHVRRHRHQPDRRRRPAARPDRAHRAPGGREEDDHRRHRRGLQGGQAASVSTSRPSAPSSPCAARTR